MNKYYLLFIFFFNNFFGVCAKENKIFVKINSSAIIPKETYVTTMHTRSLFSSNEFLLLGKDKYCLSNYQPREIKKQLDEVKSLVKGEEEDYELYIYSSLNPTKNDKEHNKKIYLFLEEHKKLKYNIIIPYYEDYEREIIFNLNTFKIDFLQTKKINELEFINNENEFINFFIEKFNI